MGDVDTPICVDILAIVVTVAAGSVAIVVGNVLELDHRKSRF